MRKGKGGKAKHIKVPRLMKPHNNLTKKYRTQNMPKKKDEEQFRRFGVSTFSTSCVLKAHHFPVKIYCK